MENAQHILLVEDEVKVAQTIKQGLEEHGFVVDVAYDGQMGQRMAQNNTYQAIILDVNLPIINGFTLCTEIRNENPHIPILMLTALGTMDDKTIGFNAGADDYLVKPFEFKELLLRVNSLLKRANLKVQIGAVLKIADLELDTLGKTVKRAGKKIDLTAKEFLLLEYLLKNRGRVVSRAEIAEKIWDITFETGTNVIEVYVNFLRKKIDKDFDLKLIHTQKGMGYVLKDES